MVSQIKVNEIIKQSGSSIGIDDFVIPEEKASIIDSSEKEVEGV